MQGFYLLVVRVIVIRFAVHGSHAMAHHTHAFVTHHAHPGLVVSPQVAEMSFYSAD
jgi:hypothetical protein